MEELLNYIHNFDSNLVQITKTRQKSKRINIDDYISKREKKYLLKSYKRRCCRCGAFLPKYQYFCGMCKSIKIRKSTKKERLQAIEYLIRTTLL